MRSIVSADIMMSQQFHTKSQDMRGLCTYLLITFGFSWAVGAMIWKTGGLGTPHALALMVVYMAGPALGALVTAWRYQPREIGQVLGLSVRPNLYWLWALVLPFVIVALSVLISMASPGVKLANPIAAFSALVAAKGGATIPLSPVTLFWLQMLVGVPIGIAINAIVLLSEELGWRGWLWWRWRPMGFWSGNLAIGFVWGVWHAPLVIMGFNYPGMPRTGPVWMVIFTMLLSPLIGWVRERGHSVFAASMFHGTMNAIAGLSFLFLSRVDMPWRGVVGLGGMIAMALLWIPLFVFQKRSTPG